MGTSSLAPIKQQQVSLDLKTLVTLEYFAELAFSCDSYFKEIFILKKTSMLKKFEPWSWILKQNSQSFDFSENWVWWPWRTVFISCSTARILWGLYRLRREQRRIWGCVITFRREAHRWGPISQQNVKLWLRSDTSQPDICVSVCVRVKEERIIVLISRV